MRRNIIIKTSLILAGIGFIFILGAIGTLDLATDEYVSMGFKDVAKPLIFGLVLMCQSFVVGILDERGIL